MIEKTGCAALGFGVAYTDSEVRLTWAAQKNVAIWAVAVKSPTKVDAIASVSMTIVKRDPSRAKVQRFEDGSSISDLGISSVTYAMKVTSGEPLLYKSPVPADEEADLNWFAKDSLGYIRADFDDRVIVHVRNGSKENVEVSAVLLYREIPVIALPGRRDAR